MARFGIIVNPNAGTIKRQKDLVERLDGLLGNYGKFVVSESKEQIPEIMHEFRTDEIDIIGITGGDSTFTYGLTHVIRTFGDDLPYVFPMRGGTNNLFAKAFDLDYRPEKLLKKMVHDYGEQPKIKIPAIARNTLEICRDGQAEPDYAFLFAAGFPAGFLHKYNEGRKDKGAGNHTWEDFRHVRFGWILARMMMSGMLGRAGTFYREIFEPIQGTLTMDGEEHKRSYPSYSCIFATTIDIRYWGVKPFMGVQDVEDHFRIVGGNIGIAHLVANSVNMITGHRFYGGSKEVLREVDMFDDYIQHFTFTPEKGTSYRLTLDGDDKPIDVPIKVCKGPKIKIPKVW